MWRRWQPGGDEVSVVKFISSLGRVSVSKRETSERCPLRQDWGNNSQDATSAVQQFAVKDSSEFWGHNFAISVFISICHTQYLEMLNFPIKTKQNKMQGLVVA